MLSLSTLAHNITCYSTRGLSGHVCSNWLPREKRCRPFLSRWQNLLRWSFFLSPGNPSIQACADCASCQRPPGRLLFIYLILRLFYLKMFLYYYFLFNPHTRQVSLFSFYSFTYCLLMEHYAQNFNFKILHVCISFLLIPLVSIMYTLSVLVCVCK